MSMFRIARPRVVAYFALELALVFAVVFALAQLTLAFTEAPVDTLPFLPALAISLIFCVGLVSTQTVSLGDEGNLPREIIVFTIVSIVLGLVCYAAVRLFATGDGAPLPALLALEGAMVLPLVVAGWRWLSVRLNLLSAIRERVLILGSGESARTVCRWIVGEHASEYGVIGFADTNENRLGTVLAMGVRIQTSHEALGTFCADRVDRVVVALDEKRGQLPVRQLMELRMRGIEIEDATSFIERIGGKIAVETMLPSWLIFSEGFKTTRVKMVLKRAVDVAHATGLLVLTAPLMLLTSLVIKLESAGPVFYRQERMGRDGVNFELLKFRSMKHGAEAKSGPTWAKKYDPRITRVGRIIRKLRIDELPQLINVLRGEMSFVGPRPEREYFVRQLEETIPYYGVRMIVRPGVTGWAQVQHGYADTEEDALEKLKYDLFYIKNSNVLLDLWIVLKTVGVVLAGSGAR